MSWIGAGIGAGIGMVIGGPIGAGIGAWLGHAAGNAKTVITERQEAQTVFFVSLFSMLAKMARADGKVSSEEAELINHIANTQMNMDAEDRKAARDIFNNALNDNYSIYDYARQYRQVMQNQQMREMVYRLLFAVAFADQTIHAEEESILKKIPSCLGLDDSVYQRLKEEFLGQEADISECYEVLGCRPDHSDNDIKRAYRKKCIEYHPDKIASKGLPESFMKFAEEQMHQVTSAYSTIMDSRKSQSP
ncbi:MAG: co-chaperone DjlA [Mariprofundus sp.]